MGAHWNYGYQENGKLNLSKQSDTLVNSFITTRRIPRNNNSSGGGFSGGGGSGGGRSFNKTKRANALFILLSYTFLKEDSPIHNFQSLYGLNVMLENQHWLSFDALDDFSFFDRDFDPACGY